MADGRGGVSETGVRYWVTYACLVLGVRPVQPPGASASVKQLYELWFEDCWCWVLEFRPSGRVASTKSVAKYASQARGWHRKQPGAGELGLGAAQSRLPSILRGAARVLPQPPPLERHGCAPEDLRRGCDAALADGSATSLMWLAALAFGFSALARGCEFALDDSRHEVWELEQHLTPGDVSFFERGGATHARLSMRKRKDLKVLRGKHAKVVVAGGGRHVDAPLRLRDWLRARRALGLPDDGPLFCWPSGECITVTQVRECVRLVMRAAGRPPELFGAHSLRIGGASAALAAGVPPTLIRLLGRWSSDVYEIYCRMSEEAALRAGAALASASVSTFEGAFHEEHLELLPREVAQLALPDEEAA